AESRTGWWRAPASAFAPRSGRRTAPSGQLRRTRSWLESGSLVSCWWTPNLSAFFFAITLYRRRAGPSIRPHHGRLGARWARRVDPFDGPAACIGGGARRLRRGAHGSAGAAGGSWVAPRRQVRVAFGGLGGTRHGAAAVRPA